MKFTDRVKNAFQGFTGSSFTTTDLTNYNLGGNQRMYPQWTQSVMSDKDMYTGYMHSAIRNRANAVSNMASENLETKSSLDEFTHPYLDLISSSRSFTNFQFWFAISAYLDLQGVFYLVAVRNSGQFRGQPTIGAVKEFQLTSPYNIKPVIDQSTQRIEGYIEQKGNLQRELPAHMVIPIMTFNPFSDTEGYAITDAVKDAQFTLKTASDHTRHSIQHNLNFPGILKAAIPLEGEQLTNFRSRVAGHKKGEPLFVNKTENNIWEDTTIDLDKSALTEVNNISLDQIIAATGNSKTMFGIEQSGVTRDTASIQERLFVSQQVIPQVKLIIDALNQDYRNTYRTEYERNKAWISIDSPLKEDIASDQSKLVLRDQEFGLFNTLLALGYNKEQAAKYASGELTLEELDNPTPQTTEQNKGEVDVKNAEPRGVEQSSQLKNSILRIDNRMVALAASNLESKTNQIQEDDLLKKREENELLRELIMVLSAYYVVVISTQGPQTVSKRMAELGMFGAFRMDAQTNRFIRNIATDAATSHIGTVKDEVLKYAQDKAAQGVSVRDISNQLRGDFPAINQKRAQTIARTETNRAITMSQYEGDRQFLSQNDLTTNAFKVWTVNSSNPCPICQSLEGTRVPFSKPFASEGDKLTATAEIDGVQRTQSITAWTDFDAGNAHPNCSCSYELVIE